MKFFFRLLLFVGAVAGVRLHGALAATVTAPAANANLQAGSNVSVTATATPTVGFSITQVVFFAGGQQIGAPVTTPPYSVIWTTPSAGGSVALTARATDDSPGNPSASSPQVSVNILAVPPTIAITGPTNGSTIPVNSPTTITVNATANGGASISKVEFLSGTTVIGTVFTPPYSFAWTPAATGNFALTARITDSNGPPAVTSTVVNVTVATPTRAVALNSPTNNTTVPAGSTVMLRATPNFTDAIVSKVSYYVDGAVVAESTVSPYAVDYMLTAAGGHTLFARGTASDGATTDSATFSLTVVPAVGNSPTVGIAAPINGAFVPTGASVPISGFALDSDGTVTGVQVFANGIPVSTVVPAANGTWSTTWTATGTGAVQLLALATDDKNNTTLSPVVGINVTAATSPTVTLTLTPGPNPTTIPAGSVRNLLATVASPAGAAIVRVEFFLNGTKIGEKTSAPFNQRVVAPSATGSYVLTARATDSTGLARDAQQVITVATAVGSPPTVNLIAPTTGTNVSPTVAVPVIATASAPGGTIANVQFYANGDTAALSAGGLDSAAPYSLTFTAATPGSYAVDAIAIDDRGNSVASNIAYVTAAFATPTVAITSPNPATTTRVTPNVPLNISATAQGGGGVGVLLVEFLIDGAPVGNKSTATSGTTYTFAWTPTSAQLGLHTLQARVTDANSQTATSAPVSLNVANVVGTPPSVTISAPTGAATTAIQSLSTVNFVATAFATPATNSITSVEFFLNDVSIGTATREQTTNAYRLTFNFGAYDFSAITPDANGRFPLTLYAIARDANGNQTISATTNLAINSSTSAPPFVQLQAVGATTIAQGTIFPMIATPSDSDGNVTQLQLFVNGATSGGAIAAQLPTTPVNFTPTAAGRYNLFVVATDDTGNTAVSSPAIVLNVNAISAPVTSVVRPADDTTVTTANTPVFLEATASSPDATQTITVSFVATGSSGARTTIANVQRVGTTNNYRAIWTPTVADTYTVTSVAAIGTTVSSNSTNSRRVTVTQVQGIAPVVTINVPGAATTASTANFTATATDSDGSVVGVEFFLNRNSIGQAVRDQITNTWRMTASFSGLTPANGVEVVALARDSAGNLAASGTSTMNITAAASIAPSVTIAASDANPAFSRQVQLTANARDTDGTVVAVQYFANATSLGTSGNAGTNFLVNWTPNQSGTFNVWGIATDSTGNTTVAATLQVVVRRNNPVLEDAAFILQTYQDIANTTTINPLVFADLDAQLGAGTLTRAQFATSLTSDPAFAPPMNLLLAYYIVMGQWPTPTNYNTLLPTARTSLANAIGTILASNEYFAKYGTPPTVALLNNPNSSVPARTFLTRLYANAGLGGPSDTDLIRFMNNDTTFGGTLGRGYNVVGVNTAIAEFVTNVNSTNAALVKRGQAAALYYQLDRPSTAVTTDQIAARVLVLAALPDMTAMADAALKDILYTYRYVTILAHPQPLLVAPRSGAIFSVDALGQPPLTYQWLLNGAPVAGANNATLYLTNVDTSKVGNYTVVVTSAQASATSDVAALTLSSTPTRVVNVSTRGPTASGNNVLIGGFIVTGPANQTRQMLIRVIGPTLANPPYNLPGVLADPRLEVYPSGATTPTLTNDNWGTQQGGAAAVTAIQQAATRVGAFALPNGSADAVVLANLAPGGYTVQAKGPNANASGLVLFEVYDATQGAPAGPKASNVSTRGNVGTGNNILIAGFVVNGAVARRVLIRGVGPTLADPRFGLPAGSTLSDPQLTLVDQGTGKIVKTNDDWTTNPDEAAQIAAAGVAGGAFPLQTGSKDAAMLLMLPPGGYTAQLNGAGNATGIAIVEVYDVDP